MIGSLLFLLVLVVLAVVCFYLGFVRKEGPREFGIFHGRAQVGFIVAVIFSVGWMWHIWNLTQMEPQLSKHVVPYPGAKYTVTYDRFVDDDASWMATVDSPPDVVMKFYSSPKNVPGWTVVEESDGVLVFRKEGAQLAILVNNEGRGSMIIYSLTKQE